jgi:hypothetical protein
MYNQMDISVDRPPRYFQVEGDPEVLRYVDAIAAGCALEIQDQAFGPSPSEVRIYMFNRYAVNGFYNQDFTYLLQDTIDMIAMGIIDGRFRNVEEAADVLVDDAVSMHGAICAAEDPELLNWCHPSVRGPVTNAIDSMQRVMSELDRYRRNPITIQEAFQTSRAQVRGGRGAPPPVNSRYGGRQGAPVVGSQQQGNGRFGSSLANQQSGNAPQRRVAVGEQSFIGNTSRATSKPARAPSRYEARQSDRAVDQQEERETVNTQFEVLKPIDWKPTVLQPFWRAWNATLWQSRVVRNADGIQQLIDREGMEVDPTKHKIPNWRGTAVPVDHTGVNAYELAKQAVRLSDIVTDQKTMIEKIPEEKKVKLHLDHLPGDITSTTLDDAWVKAAAEWAKVRAACADNDLIDIRAFRATATVSNPVLVRGIAIDDLKWAHPEETIADIINFMSDENVPIEIQAATNKRLTDVFNRALENRMCIASREVHLESFIEDYADLQEYLRENYGKMFSECLSMNEKTLIRGAIPKIDIDLKALNVALLGSEEAVVASDLLFAPMPSKYSMTFVDSYFNDFEVETDREIGSLVTHEFTNGLIDLVTAIMKKEKLWDFERHFIRTRDNITLEICQGFVNEESYLIRIVN